MKTQPTKSTSLNPGRSLRPVLMTVFVSVLGLSAAWADTAGEAQLQKTLAAHGGLEHWKATRSLAYTMKGFPLTELIARENRSTVDLVTRKNRIDGPGYTVGFNGTDAWSLPGPKSSGLPSRFVTLGSFYFVGIPFVLADEGVEVNDGGTKTYNGKRYRVLDVGFKPGVGHSAEDNYQIYIDPQTERVALIHHNVTELYEKSVRVTWVYNDYSQVGPLFLPSRLTFFQGFSETQDESQGKSYTVTNYEASRSQPDASLYTPPAGASINDQ